MTAVFVPTQTKDYGVQSISKKEKTYSLALPASWLAAGVAWDLSADFAVVTGADFSAQAVVTNHGYKWGIIGTTTTAKDGFTASSIKLVAHENKTGSSSGVEAFPAVADATNLSDITDLRVTIRGY